MGSLMRVLSRTRRAHDQPPKRAWEEGSVVPRNDARYGRPAMAERDGFLGWLVGGRGREGHYPETFEDELAWLSWKILRPSGLICAVAWLPYLHFDELLNP